MTHTHQQKQIEKKTQEKSHTQNTNRTRTKTRARARGMHTCSLPHARTHARDRGRVWGWMGSVMMCKGVVFFGGHSVSGLPGSKIPVGALLHVRCV